MKHERVFVIDYDTCSPLGIGKKEIMKSIRDNRSAGDFIARFDISGIEQTGAAEVRNSIGQFYCEESQLVKEIMSYDRKLELIVANYFFMKNRIEQILDRIPSDKKGVAIGVGLDVTPFECIKNEVDYLNKIPEWKYINAIKEKNANQININQLLNPLDISSIYLADVLSLGAFQRTILTACAASTQAIIYASKALQAGEVDAVVAGGTDSIINLIAYLAFGKLGIMSTSPEHPSKCCRPLDISRKGALIGEASGLCILANESSLKKYNLEPKFEILGFGNSLDGYRITAPDPSGSGMITAVKTALLSSKIKADQIDYINLHGTGTRSNDDVEVTSLIDVFGEYAKNISISSTKSRHGHAIAAAGIQEFNILMSCMEENLVPYNLNLENHAFGDAIDVVRGENRTRNLNIGMTNNFAFGGVNSSIIIKKI